MLENKRHLNFQRDPLHRNLFSIQELEAWASYTCENSIPELTGRHVKLRLVSSNEATDDIPSPEPNHIAAVDWLLKNEKLLHDAIVAAIFEKTVPMFYRQWEEFQIEINPPLRFLDDLKYHIDLSYIDIFAHTKNGIPYFGFEFECSWDPEHGFQVLMNGFRVVALDGDVNNTFEIKNDGGHI